MAVDEAGRVYVGDRENQRIQIFDSEGNFLKQWTGIGYPYGLVITPDQHVWMADGGYVVNDNYSSLGIIIVI